MTALTIAGNSRYIIIASGAWSTSDFNMTLTKIKTSSLLKGLITWINGPYL